MSSLDRAAVAAVDSTGQVAEILDLGSTSRTRCGGSTPPARAPSPRPAASSRPAWAAPAVGASLASPRSARAHRARDRGGRIRTAAGVGGPDALVLGAESTPAPPRRRWSATTMRPRARAPRLVATTGGPLAERARRDGGAGGAGPGRLPARAAVGYRWSPRSRRGGSTAPRRRCAARSRPPPRWRPTWPPSGVPTDRPTGRQRRSRLWLSPPSGRAGSNLRPWD